MVGVYVNRLRESLVRSRVERFHDFALMELARALELAPPDR